MTWMETAVDQEVGSAVRGQTSDCNICARIQMLVGSFTGSM